MYQSVSTSVAFTVSTLGLRTPVIFFLDHEHVMSGARIKVNNGVWLALIISIDQIRGRKLYRSVPEPYASAYKPRAQAFTSWFIEHKTRSMTKQCLCHACLILIPWILFKRNLPLEILSRWLSYTCRIPRRVQRHLSKPLTMPSHHAFTDWASVVLLPHARIAIIHRAYASTRVSFSSFYCTYQHWARGIATSLIFFFILSLVHGAWPCSGALIMVTVSGWHQSYF